MSEQRRFRIEWKHTHPIWCEVFADNPNEAIRKAKSDDRIPRTTDSDPGKDDWKKVEVRQIK